MKILALSFEFPRFKDDPIVSGEIKNAYNFIMELSRKGHDVTVLNMSQSKHPDVYKLDNVEVHTLRDITYRGVVRYIYRAWKVRSHINRLSQNFDVIHSHISYGSVGVSLSKLADTPLFTTPHGTNIPEIKTELTTSPKDRLRRVNAEMQRWLDIFAFKKSRGIISVSEFQLREMSSIYGVELKKTRVIYNGVDQRLYYKKTTECTHQRKKALFVGRACKKKGLDVIYLLAQRYPNIDFTVITGTRMFNTIGYELLGKMEKLDNCVCLEDVSEENLADFYRNADVTIVPSRGYESLPTVILESISCGTPAISVNAWGNPEAIIDHALMFKEDDINDIRRAFEHALTEAIDCNKAYRIKTLSSEVDALLSHFEK